MLDTMLVATQPISLEFANGSSLRYSPPFEDQTQSEWANEHRHFTKLNAWALLPFHNVSLVQFNKPSAGTCVAMRVMSHTQGGKEGHQAHTHYFELDGELTGEPRCVSIKVFATDELSVQRPEVCTWKGCRKAVEDLW